LNDFLAGPEGLQKKLQKLEPIELGRGFGGMGDRFDLGSPPTANKVTAKTFLEDSNNIINNHENHTSGSNLKNMSSPPSSSSLTFL
jgi:hypothetical protein